MYNIIVTAQLIRITKITDDDGVGDDGVDGEDDVDNDVDGDDDDGDDDYHQLLLHHCVSSVVPAAHG